MKHSKWRWLAVALLLFSVALGQAQSPAGGKVVPKLEPIAETKLVMEGIAYANVRGLERMLTQRPTDQQAWTHARGQALLIAEAANLLMLRPPSSQGQAVWFERSMEMRTNATKLAKTLASKDYERSRLGLVQLSETCNRCHKAFRVPIDIDPFTQEVPPPKT
jgi:hypothetical protein